MERKSQQWNEPQWVALYTKPRAEKKVDANLKKQGFESYLPLHRQLHKWSDRNKWVEVPLFSSYVFVRIVSKQIDLIRKTDGVATIVAFGPTRDTIGFISDEEITNIRRLLATETEVFVKRTEQLKKGSRVRVIEGPLKGMEGILLKDCSEGNFSVKVDTLSAYIVCQMEKDFLEIVTDDGKDKGIWHKQ